MKRRLENLRPGTLLLALVVAVFMWGMAHGVSSIERAYDVPVELHEIGDDLVVTDQNPDAINVRIIGSQAALRNIEANELRYLLDLSGSRPGDAEFEVDISRIQLPRGARIVSRSPSRILLHFDPRGRKAVAVRVDLAGEPAQGFVLEGVDVLPGRVWLSGARSQVLRLKEVVTEPVDLTGLKEDTEREVNLFIGAGNVWVEENEPVKVVLRIAPQIPPPGDVEGSLGAPGVEES